MVLVKGQATILIAESIILLASGPQCSLDLPCYSPVFAPFFNHATILTGPYTLAFRLGIFGTLCLCAGLFISSFYLWLLPYARRWGLLFCCLGFLAAPTWIALSKAGDFSPGFFKMDPLIMTQQFFWAFLWFVVGIVLWRAAGTVSTRAGGSLEAVSEQAVE